MQTVLHKAESRGHADHGWLNSWHSFSFASYHDPSRIHFGALRVLNDDTVSAGMGFGKHPHDNMEIISIPLEGELEHGDSMGNTAVIKKGDVQAMSAGTGIVHSEKNKSRDSQVRFLQIWVFPNKKNLTPRYDQKYFSDESKHNTLLTVVAPIGTDSKAVEIHQDAWLSLGNLDKGKSIKYLPKKPGNGIYAFVIEGAVAINEIELTRRDGIGMTDAEELTIQANENTEILIMEVPMNLS